MAIEVGDDLCVVSAFLICDKRGCKLRSKIQNDGVVTLMFSTISSRECTVAPTPGTGKASRTRATMVSAVVGSRCEDVPGSCGLGLGLGSILLSISLVRFMSKTVRCV
jgi:hypothetical protein